MKPVGPFWRYYGGKWRAAPRYPAPECKTIVEPFAGAAGYACRYPWRQVVLVDKDPIIAGLWAYLIAASPAEILAIPDLPEGATVDDLPICQEARWLVGFWCNLGTTQPGKRSGAWARDFGQDATNWAGWGFRARERISRDVPKIKHWRIIHGDYFEAPDIEASWVIDPPYQTAAGRHYRFSDIDFQALGAWAMNRRGQVLAHDQEGADWMPWTHRAALKSTKGSSAEVYYHRSRNPRLFTLDPAPRPE